MAGTDALTGARYPGSADSPNVNQDIQNAVNDLSDIIGGIFTSASARDTAFSAWVSQGNTMRDGLMCRVGGYPQVYRSGAWHGACPIIYTTSTVDTTLTTITRTIMTLSIPDPLFSYRLMVSGSITLTTVGVSVTIQPQTLVNGTLVTPIGSNYTNTGGADATGVILQTFNPGLSGVLTGASTATLQVVKLGGPAGNGFQAAAGDNGTSFWAQVIPT